MTAALKKLRQFLLARFVFFSLAIYTLTWLGTYLVIRLLWGTRLPPVTPLVFLSAFLLPSVLVLVISLWSSRHADVFRPLGIVFIIILLLVTLNLFFHWLPLQNYGDNGQLSRAISEDSPFTRWMLGSLLANNIYKNIWLSLAFHLSIPTNTDFYVRFTGAVLMSIASFLFVNRYPRRLSIILPLFTPIWLLLCSGYNEYYPFIAPVLLVFLLLLLWNRVGSLHPLLLGLLISILVLLYPGLVPPALLLLFLYAFQAGLKKALIAAAASMVFSVILVVILWQDPLTRFIKDYIHNLNLGETNTRYAPYRGHSIPNTPFIAPGFLFSIQHLKDVFFMFFWGGGFPSIPLLIAGAWFLLQKRVIVLKKILQDPRLALLGLFLVWQVIYLFIKIPKLGPTREIDLFFSVYLTCAFAAGLAFDKIKELVLPQVKIILQNSVFAFFLANTAPILLFLLFLGIPT